MSDTDLQLLARYTRQHAEDAFAELVRRHLDLVFSAALRQVRSPQLAEEVAQSAFTDLARQANRLAPDTILTAWLYQVTRCTAIDVVRREARRQHREQVACELNAMNTPASSCQNPMEADADWTYVEPLLDEAMHALEENDRAAVLLRYFENKSLREVGQTLGTNEDAARKRVSRAVERLRQIFAKRGVTVGASGLVIAISANAVQAAPAGLAVTISAAAALVGGSIATTASATATKAIVMTTLQKTLIATTVALAVGTGIYEARQASQLRDQVQTLRQQQTPLAEQIQQLQLERNATTQQLASLRDTNERLNRDTAELLRLRNAVTRLRAETQVSAQPSPAGSAAASWLKRVDQLQRYVEQSPKERIPEFQFLTEREWLVVADAGLDTETFQKEGDYDRAMQSLRFQAESRFGNLVQDALRKYATANNGQFPSDLSQLASYCEPAVTEMLLQLYEIKDASILPESVRRDTKVKFDWVITRKKRVNSNSTSRLAIFTSGDAYWQSPP